MDIVFVSVDGEPMIAGLGVDGIQVCSLSVDVLAEVRRRGLYLKLAKTVKKKKTWFAVEAFLARHLIQIDELCGPPL